MTSTTQAPIRMRIVGFAFRNVRNVPVFYTWLVNHKTGVLAIAAVCCLLGAFAWVTTDKIEVGPFTVPHAYEERGYTSQAISSAVVDLLRANEARITFQETRTPAEPASNLDNEDLGDEDDAIEDIYSSKVESSFEDNSVIDDIRVPLTPFTIPKFLELLRDLAGRKVTRITGQIVFADEGWDGKTDQRPVQVRYAIEYPEPGGSILGYHWWPRQVTTRSETLSANGPEDAIRKLAYITADSVNERTLVHLTKEQRALRSVARGNAYVGLLQFERATRLYDHANTISDSARAHIALGMIAEHDRDLDTAEKEYTLASKSPGEANADDAPWADLYLANLSAKRKKPTKIVVANYQKLLKRAESEEPINGATLAKVDANNNLGFYYLTVGDLPDANDSFWNGKGLAEGLREKVRACADIDPEDTPCGSFHNQAEWKKMKARALQYIDLTNAQIARSLYGIGEVSARNRDFDNAVTFYRKAIHANPKHVRSHLKLGAVLERNNRKEQAKREYEAATKADPSDRRAAVAYNHLSAELVRPHRAAQDR